MRQRSALEARRRAVSQVFENQHASFARIVQSRRWGRAPLEHCNSRHGFWKVSGCFVALLGRGGGVCRGDAGGYRSFSMVACTFRSSSTSRREQIARRLEDEQN